MTLALFCKFTKLILKKLMLSHKYVFFFLLNVLL